MNGQSTKEVKTASQIIQNLRNFNRKERDHLIKFALSSQMGRLRPLWRMRLIIWVNPVIRLRSGCPPQSH